MKLKDVKKGEMFKLKKGSKAVYVRLGYCRSLKRYEMCRFDDINAIRAMDGNTPVTTDFEF